MKAKNYLDLSAIDLLNDFGAGSHVPGSGAAAALTALIGVQLMLTVCKLTLKKPAYKKCHLLMEQFKHELKTEFEPKLIQLFHKDIEVFSMVSKFRKKASDESDDKKKKVLLEQKQKYEVLATDIPLEISDLCLSLIQKSMQIFDVGFKSARGDSGVAIANLSAASIGSIFIVLLNIKDFKRSTWKTEIITRCQTSFNNHKEIQIDILKRIKKLHPTFVDFKQLSIIEK
ncbi:MAG TPA: cyclodeaminase/cyclohydrolase family protein [Cyclobacteriaceae bacterium]|jgi:formiminotetrahydrofolate cyclodeaminase|nr:cyclodeaminase/cyclohydrolase family protein [Cyclobacteriaceae bacterium]